MRAARLRRGLAVCLACCALLSGCSMGYAPLSPTPADPVSAQAALDALERQVDLYAREIRVEEIDFARVPMIQDEEGLSSPVGAGPGAAGEPPGLRHRGRDPDPAGRAGPPWPIRKACRP